jgi:hypothetical protein
MILFKEAGRLNSGRNPDPNRLGQVERCHARICPHDPDATGMEKSTDMTPYGERTWLRCPMCRSRVRYVYKPQAADAWACRRCHRLAYRSSQEAHKGERLYVALNKMLGAMENGTGEKVFDDARSHAETLALCRAALHLDRIRLGQEQAKMSRRRSS